MPSPDAEFTNVIASLCLTASQSMDDGVSDGQAAACIEACRVAGLAIHRLTASLREGPTSEIIATELALTVDAALDEAGLTAEDCPRLAAACADEWRRAFLCH
jgi:hypothetical protein